MLPKHILAQIACLAQRIEKLEKAMQGGQLCCVESVTGSAVDNSDPKNPVINLTDIVSSGMSYLWAMPTVDPNTQEIIPNWSPGHIAPQGYLFKPDPQIPGDIWPNKNYKYLLGDTDMYGVDFKAYIDEWDNSTNPVKGYVMVTSVPDPTRYVISKILTDNVDDAGFTKVDYEYVSHNGISALGFADEEPVKVHFFIVGDAGAMPDLSQVVMIGGNQMDAGMVIGNMTPTTDDSLPNNLSLYAGGDMVLDLEKHINGDQFATVFGFFQVTEGIYSPEDIATGGRFIATNMPVYNNNAEALAAGGVVGQFLPDRGWGDKVGRVVHHLKIVKVTA